MVAVVLLLYVATTQGQVCFHRHQKSGRQNKQTNKKTKLKINKTSL